jgi:hypothetical protein
MKLTLTILFLIVISITTTDISAKPRVKAKITDNTVASLMEGLNSENLGLKSSSAYMIGELQLSKALIPLLKILHEDENEEMRIAAALALYKIGSPIAIQAVKQSIRFDDSERVSKLCANFYGEFLKSKLIGEGLNVDVAKTALK